MVWRGGLRYACLRQRAQPVQVTGVGTDLAWAAIVRRRRRMERSKRRGGRGRQGDQMTQSPEGCNEDLAFTPRKMGTMEDYM